MAFVVAVCSAKGGVGKTTLAVSLAAAASWEKVPALVVDLDAQCSATSWAIGRERMQQLAIEETVATWATAGEVVHGVARKPVAAVLRCATLPFDHVPGVLVAASSREFRMAELTALELSRFEGVVVLDCPPDVDVPVLRGVAPVVNVVVTPIESEPAALAAVPEVAGWLWDVGRSDLVADQVVVLNRVQRTAVHQACEKVVREVHGAKVWRRVIPKATAVPEAEMRREVVGRATPTGKLFAELWRHVVDVVRVRRAA